jgi:hypothetical protein
MDRSILENNTKVFINNILARFWSKRPPETEIDKCVERILNSLEFLSTKPSAISSNLKI